jgi:hypothetical protein
MSFPKEGNIFPGMDGGPPYSVTIANALREQLGDTHQAIKTIRKWTGANERTVKNWLARSNGPSGEHLVALVRNSDVVLNAFLLLAGRRHAIAVSKLAEARDQLSAMLELLQYLLE